LFPFFKSLFLVPLKLRCSAWKLSLMELRWTSKALSDLARLYDFLSPVNKPAAARTVQALAAAPASLLVNPRIGEKLDEFDPREVRRILVGKYEMRFATKSRNPRSTCCGCGIHARIGSDTGRLVAEHGKSSRIGMLAGSPCTVADEA